MLRPTKGAQLIGQPAPDFSLRDQDRSLMSLEDFSGSPAVIVFMPLAFTSVCGGEMCEIRDNLGELSAAGARLAVITCDNIPANKAWANSEGFSYPILSDFWPHGAVTTAYGCFNERLGVAHRSTFVLDGTGIVRNVVATDSLGEARPFGSYLDAVSAL